MQPTIKDVALRAGVSVATVSRVMNGGDLVSDKTRAHVKQAIADLKYHQNAMARSLKTRQSGLIGIISPDISAITQAVAAQAIDSRIQLYGYNAIIANSQGNPGKEKANVNIMLEWRVDGIIFTAPLSMKNVHMARSKGVPVVIFSRRTDNSRYHYIDPDNYSGAYEATQYLINLGHKRIGIIVEPNHRGATNRLTGYRAAMSDAGLELDPGLVVKGYFGLAQGYEAMKKFLALNPLPTAIIACSDALAIGAMQTTLKAGLRIPDDISFIGFGDVQAVYTIPSLTSVHIFAEEIGILAGEMLMAQIRGEIDRYPKENVISCRLIERESTARVPPHQP